MLQNNVDWAKKTAAPAALIWSEHREYIWACSLGGILEEFGWFEGMLEEFVREKHYSGWKNKQIKPCLRARERDQILEEFGIEPILVFRVVLVLPFNLIPLVQYLHRTEPNYTSLRDFLFSSGGCEVPLHPDSWLVLLRTQVTKLLYGLMFMDLRGILSIDAIGPCYHCSLYWTFYYQVGYK